MSYEIAILSLAILSSFFSGLETAVLSANRFIITAWKDKGNKRAARSLEILNDLPNAMAIVLVGNNIVNIAAASFIVFIASQEFLLKETQLSLVAIIQAIFFLIFCEVSPKVIAKAKAESYLMFFAYPFSGMIRFFKPLTWISRYISKGAKKIFKIREIDNSLIRSRDEINHLFKVGEREGVIDEDHQNYVSEILSFKERTAYEIMTPTIDIISAELNSDLKDLVALVAKHKFSRLPIFEGRVDNIIGYIFYRDLLQEERVKNISEILEAPFYVPATKNIFDLHLEMQNQDIPLAFVVNEDGAVIGMLSYEDMAEEMVGEIQTSDHLEEDPIVKVSETTYLLEGDLDIDFFQKYFSINVKKMGFEKIAGFMTYKFGRIPERGEKFKYQKNIFIVEEATKRSVEKVKIILGKPLISKKEKGGEDD